MRAVGVAGRRGRQVAGVAAVVKCIVGNLIFLDEIAFCSIKMPTTYLKGGGGVGNCKIKRAPAAQQECAPVTQQVLVVLGGGWCWVVVVYVGV